MEANDSERANLKLTIARQLLMRCWLKKWRWTAQKINQAELNNMKKRNFLVVLDDLVDQVHQKTKKKQKDIDFYPTEPILIGKEPSLLLQTLE